MIAPRSRRKDRGAISDYKFTAAPRNHVCNSTIFRRAEYDLQVDEIDWCIDIWMQAVVDRTAVRGRLKLLPYHGIIDRTAKYTKAQQLGPMSRSVPVTAQTRPILENLASLAPTTLACMHGSSFSGDGGAALRDLADVFEQI